MGIYSKLVKANFYWIPFSSILHYSRLWYTYFLAYSVCGFCGPIPTHSVQGLPKDSIARVNPPSYFTI